METVVQDVRHALRSLGRRPGFTFIVILTLALGIGANTGVFSFINALLLRPLPFRELERLVRIVALKKDVSRCSSCRICNDRSTFSRV